MQTTHQRTERDANRITRMQHFKRRFRKRICDGAVADQTMHMRTHAHMVNTHAGIKVLSRHYCHLCVASLTA